MVETIIMKNPKYLREGISDADRNGHSCQSTIQYNPKAKIKMTQCGTFLAFQAVAERCTSKTVLSIRRNSKIIVFLKEDFITARKPSMKIRRYMQRLFVSPLFHPYQKRKASRFCEAFAASSSPSWTRTKDPLINSQML